MRLAMFHAITPKAQKLCSCDCFTSHTTLATYTDRNGITSYNVAHIK